MTKTAIEVARQYHKMLLDEIERLDKVVSNIPVDSRAKDAAASSLNRLRKEVRDVESAVARWGERL